MTQQTQDRYFTTVGNGPEHEVTKAEFVALERACGFHDTMGQPEEPATASFSSEQKGVKASGRIEYGTEHFATLSPR